MNPYPVVLLLLLLIVVVIISSSIIIQVIIINPRTSILDLIFAETLFFLLFDRLSV